MATALVVVPCYDRVFLSGSWREVLRRRGVVYLLYLPGLIWLAVALAPSFTPGSGLAAGFGVEKVSAGEYLRSQPAILFHYLALSLWPATLVLDYSWPVETDFLRIAVPGVLLVTALLVAGVLLLRARPAGFLLGSFFLILAPTSSVVPIEDLAFEHRMYLPLALLCVGVVLVADRLLRRLLPRNRVRVPVAAVLLSAVLLALVVRTRTRNADYADPVRLWAGNVAARPDRYRARYNLALALDQRGDEEAAMAEYRQVLSLHPGHGFAHSNLGILLVEAGELDAARQHLERAVQLEAALPSTHNNLGGLYEKLGDDERAEAAYRRALALDPDLVSARSNLATLLARTGRFEEARRHFERALAEDPERAESYFRLGMVLAQLGELGAAEARLREAVALDPELAKARFNLALLLLRRGDRSGAAAELRRCLALSPDLHAAAVELAWILAAAPEDSLRDGAAALRIAQGLAGRVPQPGPPLRELLAAAYAEAGRFAEAIGTLEALLEEVGGEPADERTRRLEAQLEDYREGRAWRRP
jgi:tetratricopeptide (TPR) repeat protein